MYRVETVHAIWPVGQAVKTAASHAVNIGSIPVRVTRKASLHSLGCGWLFSCCGNGLVLRAFSLTKA